MNFKCDKITHKELADGTIRLYVDTGEYEYDNVLGGLQKLRKKGGRETSYKVQIEIENAPSDSNEASENEYSKLWGLIEIFASIRGLEKLELAQEIKRGDKEKWNWENIDSFTELSDKDRKLLEKSLQQLIGENTEEELKGLSRENK